MSHRDEAILLYMESGRLLVVLALIYGRILCHSGLGAIAIGNALAWTSPVLPQLNGIPSGSLSVTVEQGWLIGSFLAIGAFLSVSVVDWLAERMGKKCTILFLIILLLVHWFLIIFANTVYMLYAARLFAGAAIGGICVMAPTYIDQISEPADRGVLNSLFHISTTVGIFFTYVVGGCTDWRTLSVWCAIVSSIIFVLAFLCVCSCVPETPHHAGHNEMDLFNDPANRRALNLCLMLVVIQQFSGFSAVIFYTETIFKSAGSSLDPTIATIIVGVVHTIVTIISSWLIAYNFRRSLLLVSSIMMCLSLAALGGCFQLQADNYRWLPLVCILLFIIGFSLGFGPVPRIMMGELLSPECKVVASRKIAIVDWVLVFFITTIFPMCVNAGGSQFLFWIFAAIMVVGVIIVSCFIPETNDIVNEDPLHNN